MNYRSRFSFTIITLTLISSASGQEAVIKSVSNLPAEARFRLGSDRYRVDHFISEAAISPDGKEIAVSTGSTQFHILSAESGKTIRSFVISEDLYNYQFCYTPDGKRLLAACREGIFSWDVIDGQKKKMISDIDKEGRHGSFSISDDGKIVSVSTMFTNASVRVMRMSDGGEICSFKPLHKSQYFHSLSSNGSMVATWGQHSEMGQANAQDKLIPRCVHVWDVKTSKLIAALDTEVNNVSAVRFSPDEKYIATSGMGTVKLWDIAKGKCVRKFPTRLGTKQPGSLLFSPDGKNLSHSVGQGCVQTWEISTGNRIGQCERPITLPAKLMYRPDGTLLAWRSLANSVIMWEVPSGKLLTPPGGHFSPATRMQFTLDNKQLISFASYALPVRWDVKSGREIQIESRLSDQKNPGQFPVLYSPNFKFLVGGSPEGVSLWESTAMNESFAIVGKNEPINLEGLFVFSPNSRRLTATSRKYVTFEPSEIPVWDVESGVLLQLLHGQDGAFTSAAFSTDGEVLTTCSYCYEIPRFSEVWSNHIVTGKLISKIRIPEQEITNIAFLDDRCFVALITANQRQKIYDAFTGQQVRSLDAVSGLRATCLEVSPDQRLVGIGMSGLGDVVEGKRSSLGERRVVIYEAASGSIRQSFEIPGEIVSMAFSRDNKSLAVALGDTTILLYDLEKSHATNVPKASGIETYWKSLEDPSAPKAWAAVRAMVANPAESVSMIKERLSARKISKADGDQIAKWIVDLNSPRYAERETAMRELVQHASLARDPVRHALAKKTMSLEMRERLQKLAESFNNPPLEPIVLRPLRAVEVLERINTPAAMEHLKTLAAGGESALTSAARDALARLEGR